MSEQEQLEALNKLKIRTFDAEDAAKDANNLVGQLIEFVSRKHGLEDVKTIEDFAKAMNEMFPDSEAPDTEAVINE